MTFELRDYQVSVADAVLVWVKYRNGVSGFVVAPGGSGKSVMIAKVAERIVAELGKRVVILARNERLLRQNRAKIAETFQSEIGIYCDGLGEKRLDAKITVASVQSIYKFGAHFKDCIILADEAHNISNNPEDETQYWTFINEALRCQLIGFTATAFRTTSGKLNWGSEIINIPLQRLFDKGHLVRPTNKEALSPDLSRVDVLLNEYAQKQLEIIYTDPKLLEISVEKIARYSVKRSSVIIFGQSLKHLDLLATAMRLNGMPATIVDGTTDKAELHSILQSFERREFKYLLNCQLLKEGIDLPCIDMVVVLRSTVSKTLWEQMLYRGTRPYIDSEGIIKKDFLVCDMGGNLSRHGGLGTPHRDKAKGEATSPRIGKVCPQCEEWIEDAKLKQCLCGFEFPEVASKKVDHNREPDTRTSVTYEPLREHNVIGVSYHEHKNRVKGTITLRVDYHTDYERVSEWLCPYHDNDWVRGKCGKFFRDRGHPLGSDPNSYAMDDVLWHCQHLRKPTKIMVDHSDKFPRIKGYIYDEDNTRQIDGHRGGDTACIGEILGDDHIPF